MRLFVGLDVSLAKTAVCVVSEHGRIVKEAEVASEPEAIVRFAGELDGTIAALGLEAGPLSQWLHRGLSEAGLYVVRMETRQVKGALKAMPIKTDRRDAEGIARLLHLGWFRPVHCKSVSAQEVRALLGARKAIQHGMIALELSRRGLLGNFGLKVGAISRGRCEPRVQELACGPPMLEAATEPLLRARAGLRQEPGRARAPSPAAGEGGSRLRLADDHARRRRCGGPDLPVGHRRSNAVLLVQEGRALGRADNLAPPVGRARRERRDHPGGRRQPPTSPLPGGHGHDEPRSRLLAEKLGGTGGQASRPKARKGRLGAAHRLCPAPHVEGHYRAPARRPSGSNGELTVVAKIGNIR